MKDFFFPFHVGHILPLEKIDVERNTFQWLKTVFLKNPTIFGILGGGVMAQIFLQKREKTNFLPLTPQKGNMKKKSGPEKLFFFHNLWEKNSPSPCNFPI